MATKNCIANQKDREDWEEWCLENQGYKMCAKGHDICRHYKWGEQEEKKTPPRE